MSTCGHKSARLAGLVGAALALGCFHDAPPTQITGAASGGSTGDTGGDPTTGTASGSGSGGIGTTTSAGPESTSTSSGTSDPGTTSGATTTGLVPDMGAPASVCPDSPDLLACYTFENGWEGGQLVDASGHGHDGVMQGATQATGRRGSGAATTDLSTLAVAAADAPAIQPAFTVMAWIGPHELPQSERVGVLDRDGHYGIFIDADGKAQCGGWDAVVSQAGLPLDGWTHVACTWKGGIVSMFIDGVADAAGPPLGSQPQPGASLVLGNDSPPSAAEALVGTIDEVLLWQRALTAAELCDVAGLDC